jgi:adenine phosphoribosyltransferase
VRKTYQLEICGLKRELPIIAISPGVSIASFVILGDTELVCAVAPEIVKRLPPIDVIISAEAKGIPLVHEVSRLLNMNYIVARKSVKAYMDGAVIEEVVSEDSYSTEVLCLNGADVEKIRNKRVAIIDDIIRTGASMDAIERLVIQIGGQIVAKAAVLAQGDNISENEYIFLDKLPIFES